MKVERVLVYISGTNPTESEKSFLDTLGKPYTCRNAQYFNNAENFSVVYNLANSDRVAKAYPNATNPLEKPKAVQDVVQEVVQVNKGGRPPKAQKA